MFNLDLLKNYPATAIFGSSARSDSDNLSDIDLLIVSDQDKNSKEFNDVKSLGFSPSIYSWNGLEKLSQNGSLFLIHLKNEALILKDENNRLKSLLLKTKPVGNYKNAQLESIELAELTAGIPDNALLKLWAADVLAVAFRNYMISYAAQRNEYIFSYKDLIDYAERNFNLDSSTVECLSKLREWKASYRNKASQTQTSLPKLADIMLAQSFFNMNSDKSIYSCDTNNEFIHMVLNRSNNRNWYQNLRIYEGAFRAINKDAVSVKDALEMEQLISSPSFYATDGNISWKRLKSFVLTHAHAN